MTPQRVLYVGGTGTISWSCVRRSLAAGTDVSVLNRGMSVAAEDLLLERYGRDGFPVTIVRPSHTYDHAKPPVPGDWTVIDRIVRGREIVVPGDGTSLWTLTHAEDFAVGLVGLLGNPAAIGEAFHITSDFVYSWNQIYEILAAAAGTQAHLAHVPTEFLPFAAPDWRWSELIQGDLQYSVILDNFKIRAYVPEFAPRIGLHEAARDILSWRLAHAEQARPDPEVDAVIDRLLSGYHESARFFAALAPRQPAMS